MKIITPRSSVRIHAPNLLRNGGAEQGTVSPSYWTSSGANATTDTTPANVYAGTRSFKITGGSDTWTSEYMDVDASEEYTAMFWIKTSTPNATFTVNYYTPYGSLISSDTIYTYRATRDWAEIMLKFQTPATCGLIKVVLANSAGTVWFDTMAIAGDFILIHDKDVVKLEVVEKEGRAKTAAITLANTYGKYSSTIQIGYTVEIWIGTQEGLNKKFSGIISSSPRTLSESNSTIIVDAEHGDALFLYDRCNGENYVSQTWEDIIKDLVEKHFADITTNHVGAFGGSISHRFTQRDTLQDAWDYIMEQTGWIIYLDDNWDFHFEDESLTDSGQRIVLGENVAMYDIDYDKSLLCNCLGVFYQSDLSDYVEYEDTESVAVYGRYKEVVDKDYYTSESTAKAFAQSYVESRKDLKVSASIKAVDTWLSELSTLMTVKVIVGTEALNDDFEIKSITHTLDSTGYYTNLEVNSQLAVVQEVLISYNKRLKKLEEANSGTPDTYNIWKNLRNNLAVLDSVEIYAQGQGNSAVWDKARWNISKYDPQSATEWVLIRSVSTS